MERKPQTLRFETGNFFEAWAEEDIMAEGMGERFRLYVACKRKDIPLPRKQSPDIATEQFSEWLMTASAFTVERETAFVMAARELIGMGYKLSIGAWPGSVRFGYFSSKKNMSGFMTRWDG